MSEKDQHMVTPLSGLHPSSWFYQERRELII